MLTKNFMMGSDPEFMGYDTINNKPVSLVGLIPGTKDEPASIIDNCGIQLDNVGAEITIPPQHNVFDLFAIINKAKQHIEDTILNQYNIVLESRSSGEFTAKELRNKTARTFGCDPSFSIYTGGAEIPKNLPVEYKRYRSFGFHLHFSWLDCTPSYEELMDFVFLCDLYLGIPSIQYDDDHMRRSIYGKLGDFRLPHYGVEYRTLGSSIFKHPDFVDHGINNIKENINNIGELKDRYYESFRESFFSNDYTNAYDLVTV